MFKPVQFSSQYTYDVLYKRGTVAQFRPMGEAALGKNLVPQVLRPSGLSGVSVQGITYGDETRLMIDDQRGHDANLALQAMQGSEDIARVNAAMLADKSLGLDTKSAPQVEALLGNPMARAEFLMKQNGTIKAPEQTDHVKFFFANGEGGTPVLDHVELQTRSQRLINLAQTLPAEEAAKAAEETEDTTGTKKPAPDGPQNPLAALQAAFGLPLDKIVVKPFTAAAPDAPAPPVQA